MLFVGATSSTGPRHQRYQRRRASCVTTLFATIVLLSAQVHPLVYAGVVGLALWFALAAWGFADDGYTDYLLVVVSGFVAIAVTLPLILSRIGRKGDQSADAGANRRDSFRIWA